MTTCSRWSSISIAFHQRGLWVDTNVHKAGVPARLGPHLDPVDIDINVVRRDDGSIALIQRYNGEVIAETPLDIATAQRLAGELLAAVTPKRRRLR